VFYEYPCFSSLSNFIQIIHILNCVCVYFLSLFKVQFICVVNLLIICVFLYTLLMNVVVLGHLKVAVGNFGNVLVT